MVPKDCVEDLPIRKMAAGRLRWPWSGWAALMQSSRALPTPAESAIGWDFQTIHWGSVCHRPQEPRISIAAHFMSRDCRPQREEQRRLNPLTVPTFSQRLWAIAFSVRYFRLNEIRSRRYLQLADRLRRHAARQNEGIPR